MDDGSPGLEIGFAIDTGGSLEELLRLQSMMDTTEAKIFAEARKIEQATGNMVNLGGAIASVTSYGNAATRELQSVRREKAATEKAGEALVRQLDREAASLGKTRDELRDAKVETIALTAAQQGNVELADRLLGASRRRGYAAEATAEANEIASQKAVVAAELEANAVREAAFAYQMFEAKARQGAVAGRELAAREAAAAADLEAKSVREAAFAYNMFEAAARRGETARREQEAAQQRLTGETNQLRAALDPMFAAQQRFDVELARAEKLYHAGAISVREYGQAQQLARDTLQKHAQAVAGAAGSEAQLIDAQQRGTASAGQYRQAMQQLSFQANDVATQFAAGTPLAQIFAQQSGQVFQALGMLAAGAGTAGKSVAGAAEASSDAGVDIGGLGDQVAGVAEKATGLTGKLGAVAGFLSGPWGAVTIAAMAVLTPFVAKLFEGNDALDDALNKLKEDARATEATAGAKDLFRRSQEGVSAAIRDGTEATRESIKAQASAAEQANADAQKNIIHLQQVREETTALLVQARARLEIANASNFGAIGAAAAGVARMIYSEKVADLLKLEAKNANDARGAWKLLQVSRVGLAAEDAKLITDPLARIKKRFDAEVNAATNAAYAKIAAGQEVDQARKAALTRELAGIELARNAAVKAEQDRTSAARQTADQIGRNISLAEARGIAESVGGRVTSDQRSFATQKRLHDKYVAYKSGNGPWAALAAKPGTSNHELGLALDVAKSDGVTLKKLVAAYRAAGVKVTEALDEGSHYHIAWKKVGIAARQQTAEITAAARQQAAELRAAARETTDAEATETQTANLYALAKAYEASGGAALVATARVKAQSEAIRKGRDEDAAVARDVGLAIAQRVADAAQGTAAMREQASIQASVNASVAAGTVPAERAAQLVADQIADLPLLGAIQAAQDTKNVAGAKAATDALEAQRAARKTLSDEQRKATFDTAMATGVDRLTELQEELRLVGATDAARIRALATLKATQEARLASFDPVQAAAYIAQQVDLTDKTEDLAAAQRSYNDALSFTADKWDLIAQNVQSAAGGMADAFGSAGRAIGDMASIYAGYQADRARLDQQHAADIKIAGKDQAAIDRANTRFALQSSTAQIGAFGDMASAAKGFFNEKSAGYKALAIAEKVFRAVEFAMSVRAMAQDAIETGTKLGGSAARTAANAVEAVAKAIASLPFPANLAAGAATVAALAAIGISIAGGFGGGGKNSLEKANDGKGTVLGDADAKSDSIKNSIDALKEVDTLMLGTSRQMASSLRSIENQIGGLATLLVRAGDVNASGGVAEGFKANAIGSVLGSIPVIGGILKGLFGTSTKVVGGGLFGASQSLGSVLDGGFDASTYSDVQKKKKFFGLTTSSKYSTKYGAADPALENQFTLILRSFNDAITAAAGPLGVATGDIQGRLRDFVIDIGKIDLKDLTGAEIQEKLSAVFGAAADDMANAAFPGLERFQKVGEGAFETLVRVSSTVEAVTASLDLLGATTRALGVDAKIGLADQFDSVGDLTSAVNSYFETFYTKAEQGAAKTAQMGKAFDSLGLTMPGTLAAFRQLVEAQDLTTAAGQATYATLLQLAPAFADLKSAMEGAKSAADILGERQDLERRMLELQGDTAALRALDLAKLDASNRPLQGQLWAMQDAQEAAKAADELRKAWSSVGDSIMDEVKRIRGLTDVGGNGNFASLMGQFNTATAAARGGDMDAAKALPGLSQALLAAAALVATSRQELDRVQVQTAASLEATNAALGKRTGLVPAAASNASILDAASSSKTGSTPAAAANENVAIEIRALREEVKQLRADNNAGHAQTAGNTGRVARKLEDVTAASGGEALSVASAA